ncbi:MAG: FIMAH domain-containing protein [Planctomycetota bacterium]|jgi:hypothetical protein
MRKNSLKVTMSVVGLAMLIPVVALADSHGGYGGYNYDDPNVTPTTVAPGDTITVDFSYTVTISGYNFNGTWPNTSSRWEIRLDANYQRADSQGNYIPHLAMGRPYWLHEGQVIPPTDTVTETFYVNVDVVIPEDTEDGDHTVEIYSCPWSYKSAWNGLWHVITINVEQTDPAQAIIDLINTVEGMNLQQGIDNSLDAKLDAAANALDDVNNNNDVAAINSLNSFINAVEAQRGSKLTDEQADTLIADAEAIIAMLTG